MNIYALKGHKVRCDNITAGFINERETAAEYLKLGQEYTVERTEVGSWKTDVYLVEFPGVAFNSCMFEDVNPQSSEQDKLHADYERYN